VLSVLVVLVIASLVSMPTDLLKGMVLGAAFVAGPAALWALTVQATGTAPVMMGDQAEQWTASELRKLGRRGWRLVNHVALVETTSTTCSSGPEGRTPWRPNGARHLGTPSTGGMGFGRPLPKSSETLGCCGCGIP
jgi:hypothetical protein